MKLTIGRNDWGLLKSKLLKLQYQVPQAGENWARESAQIMNNKYRDHLQTQGREGGEPPPLSRITLHLYQRLGNPNGSGIRDHIRMSYRKQGNRYTVVFGILQGKPTMVAKVQDQGAIIQVTPKMRGFLAYHGVFLKDTTTHIHIPARHGWSNSLEDTKRLAKEKLRNLLREILR